MKKLLALMLAFAMLFSCAAIFVSCDDSDSYEELDGYRLRFGLTWVNHETGERVWKKSRYYFSEICKTKLVN